MRSVGLWLGIGALACCGSTESASKAEPPSEISFSHKMVPGEYVLEQTSETKVVTDGATEATSVHIQQRLKVSEEDGREVMEVLSGELIDYVPLTEEPPIVKAFLATSVSLPLKLFYDEQGMVVDAGGKEAVQVRLSSFLASWTAENGEDPESLIWAQGIVDGFDIKRVASQEAVQREQLVSPWRGKTLKVGEALPLEEIAEDSPFPFARTRRLAAVTPCPEGWQNPWCARLEETLEVSGDKLLEIQQQIAGPQLEVVSSEMSVTATHLVDPATMFWFSFEETTTTQTTVKAEGQEIKQVDTTVKSRTLSPAK